MCVCEKFVARIPLVDQFFLHEEFLGTFFDGANTPFGKAVAPRGPNTGGEEFCSQWL
jgi:hypothetical protein